MLFRVRTKFVAKIILVHPALIVQKNVQTKLNNFSVLFNRIELGVWLRVEEKSHPKATSGWDDFFQDPELIYENSIFFIEWEIWNFKSLKRMTNTKNLRSGALSSSDGILTYFLIPGFLNTYF